MIIQYKQVSRVFSAMFHFTEAASLCMLSALERATVNKGTLKVNELQSAAITITHFMPVQQQT